MAALFRALTAVPEIDFQAHHVLSSPPGRPWQVSLTDGYSERSFQTRFGLDWHLIRTVIQEKNSFFLSACWGDPTNQISLLLAILLGRRYAVFNDAPDVSRARNPLKAAVRDTFLKLVFGRAEAVLGSGEPALRIMESMGARREKLINFPYFVDPANFSVRHAWFDGTGPLTLISSGRLIPEKAYSDCMEALSRVRGPFFYRLMGTGPEMDNLRKQAVTLGIADKVEFLGWVDPNESRAAFESGDVFLHPCRFEPFGVVVAEAMAASLVVVASDKTYAALDRITDGENGFLYKTGDAEQLVARIQLLMDHPELIRPIGEKARAKAEEWPLSRAQDIIKKLLGL